MSELPLPPIPWGCCISQPPENRFYFSPADDWLVIHPDQRLFHLHHGRATVHEDINTAEAQWIYDTSLKIFARYPEIQFSTIADFSASITDQSEFPSTAAMDIYKQLLRHPQTAQMIGYGLSNFLVMLADILKIALGKLGSKIKIATSRAQAEAMHAQWLENVLKENQSKLD